ncbi:MAG: 3-dehydroquinate synthase family protein [Phycisphaerales bacterium]
MSERTVRVELGERGYDVVVGAGVVSTVGARTRAAVGERAKRAFMVVDAGVPGAMVERARGSLEASGFAVASWAFDPSERVKTISTFGHALAALGATGQDRAEPVVALGGGIVGDVAGFVAASYRRGVAVVQCPTTLLSMVDASVGGKTGVNLEVGSGEGAKLAKNMVGAFWQPIAVLADVDALASLSDRHRRSGLAECVKHAMIAQRVGGEHLLAWMEAQASAIAAYDPGTMAELIARNVAVKARVVAGDERETAASSAGGRALLNLGHTFGHAIETIPHLSPEVGDSSLAPLHHGEAVALGLIAASAAAESVGLIDGGYRARVRALVERFGLPTRVAGLAGSEALIGAMRGQDKKVVGGVLRVVMPDGEGSARVVDEPGEAALRAGWDAIRAGDGAGRGGLE